MDENAAVLRFQSIPLFSVHTYVCMCSRLICTGPTYRQTPCYKMTRWLSQPRKKTKFSHGLGELLHATPTQQSPNLHRRSFNEFDFRCFNISHHSGNDLVHRIVYYGTVYNRPNQTLASLSKSVTNKRRHWYLKHFNAQLPNGSAE